jgi:hypothetical protein
MNKVPTSSRPRSGGKPTSGLAWSIRSEDIPFMRPGPAEAAIDASAGCMNDCGGITRLPQPTSRKTRLPVQ